MRQDQIGSRDKSSRTFRQLTCALCFVTGILSAQTGSITGQISDPSGASVSKASVKVTQLSTNVEHLRHGQNYMRKNDETIAPKGHATDLFTDWSIEYLNQRKRDGLKFFLYLAYNAPHVPIQPVTEVVDLLT